MQQLIADIQELLERRETVYPVQDEPYKDLFRIIRQLTEILLAKATEQENNWRPDFQLIKKTGEFIERPVFICGGMKTGTTLLTRLLDNHPSLMVMPGDSHYYTNFRKYSGGYVDLCQYWIQRFINPTGQHPFWFFGRDMEAYVNFLLYLKYFLNTKYDTFQSVVAATFCANPNRKMSTLYWVEKKPENERYVQWFVKRFPQAKFLHIVRDPLPNIAAIKKLSDFKSIPFRAISYSVRLKYLMKLGADNQKCLGKSTYVIVRYEDLIADTEQEIRAFTTRLGIQFDKTLLITTENGVSAKANSMYATHRIMGSIGTQIQDKKWNATLTEREKEEIVTVLSAQVVPLGYTEWTSEEVIRFQKGSLRGFLIKCMEGLILLKYSLKQQGLRLDKTS